MKIDYREYLNSISNFLNNNKNIIDKSEIQNIIPNFKSKEIMKWSGLLILASYHKILYGILNKEDKKIYKKMISMIQKKQFQVLYLIILSIMGQQLDKISYIGLD